MFKFVGQEFNSRDSSLTSDTSLLPLVCVVCGKVMFSVVSVCMSIGGSHVDLFKFVHFGNIPQTPPPH